MSSAIKLPKKLNGEGGCFAVAQITVKCVIKLPFVNYWPQNIELKCVWGEGIDVFLFA